MADLYTAKSDYRNTGNSRRDPRLVKRDSLDSNRSLSPPNSNRTKAHSPSPPRNNWNSASQTAQPAAQRSFNNNQSNITASYQHLAPNMYNEYQSTGYPNTYQQYQQNYSQPPPAVYNQYGQQQAGYPQQTVYPTTGTVQPGPPGEEYPHSSWAPVAGLYPGHGQHSHQNVSSASSEPSKNDEKRKKDGVLQEEKQQKATLNKQRDEYVRNDRRLRKQLHILRAQKQELLVRRSPEEHIVHENVKLQVEIQNKRKSIHSMIDMLSDVIGDGMKASDFEKEDSPVKSPPEQSDKFRYVHYDPELHWCRYCDVFPKTAKDFLNHLHTAEHRQALDNAHEDTGPWHKLPEERELPSVEGAPVKRVPIKGLQFFVSATAWFCKLCDTWIGDLHCASKHLKSQLHSQNYTNFMDLNPHFEIEWLKDRNKASVRCSKKDSDSDTVQEALPDKKHKKRKGKRSPSGSIGKDKKRKKKSKKRKKAQSSDSSSSSSSSDSTSDGEKSDRSKSIHVAMRNKMTLQAQIIKEELGGQWETLGRMVKEKEDRHNMSKSAKSVEPEPIATEDNVINQWMTVHEASSEDKNLLDSLKDRLKQKQEVDKNAEYLAAEQKKKEHERELKERFEKQRTERDQREKEEEERMERERNKDKRGRKRRSHSISPDRHQEQGNSGDRRRYRKEYSNNQERYHRRYSDNGRHSSEEMKSSEELRRPKKYDDKNEYESRFDKKATESASKNKKSSQGQSHKKLPFIGRMPLFKSRKPEEEREIKREEYEKVRTSRFQPGNLARQFMPDPELVIIPKLSTPVDTSMIQYNAENPPPPPQIIPDPPTISEIIRAPPPPIINQESDVQDMELDDGATPLPPGVPVAEAKPLAKPAGNHLPRDFQDALNIIYPEPGQMDAAAYMAQYPYGMDYSMMYSAMYDFNQQTQETVSAVPDIPPPPEPVALDVENPPLPPDDSKEDLAMLGIDADDMAAQMF